MQLGELQFGEMPHFFNTPHAFKKNWRNAIWRNAIWRNAPHPNYYSLHLLNYLFFFFFIFLDI